MPSLSWRACARLLIQARLPLCSCVSGLLASKVPSESKGKEQLHMRIASLSGVL